MSIFRHKVLYKCTNQCATVISESMLTEIEMNEKEQKINKILRYLFSGLLFFLVTTAMIVAADTLFPEWVYQFTRNDVTLQVTLSILLFGLFSCLNAAVLISIRHYSQPWK